MTIELIFLIAAMGIIFNIISLWAIMRVKNDQIETYRRAQARLNYLEVGMSFHGLIPMPWEVEEIEEIVDEIKSFKQEENVVYLQKEEQ
jgi:predicted aldo/keto reductase-like oxidoreductase